MQVQYFLPMLTRDRRVLGLVPHASTTYTGNETTVTVSSVVYPVRRVTFESPRRIGQVMDYMAIDISPTEERTYYKNLEGATRAGAMSLLYWAGTNQVKIELEGDLEYFLRGKSKDVSALPSTPSAPSMTGTSRTWYANAPFSNAPFCQFIDLSWAQLVGLDAAVKIANVSLGAPSADPGNGIALKALLVYPSNQVNAAARDSNVRIIRVTKGAIPPGSYIWPISVTDTSGQTTTVNITIVIA